MDELADGYTYFRLLQELFVDRSPPFESQRVPTSCFLNYIFSYISLVIARIVSVPYTT